MCLNRFKRETNFNNQPIKYIHIQISRWGINTIPAKLMTMPPSFQKKHCVHLSICFNLLVWWWCWRALSNISEHNIHEASCSSYPEWKYLHLLCFSTHLFIFFPYCLKHLYQQSDTTHHRDKLISSKGRQDNIPVTSRYLKERFTIFKVCLKQQSGVHINTERGFPRRNHSSCSYWVLKDPLQMCF